MTQVCTVWSVVNVVVLVEDAMRFDSMHNCPSSGRKEKSHTIPAEAAVVAEKKISLAPVNIRHSEKQRPPHPHCWVPSSQAPASKARLPKTRGWGASTLTSTPHLDLPSGRQPPRLRVRVHRQSAYLDSTGHVSRPSGPTLSPNQGRVA